MYLFWSNRKIKAYSLTELLIAMVIIVLVMGFAFFTLNYLQQKVRVYSNHLLAKLAYTTTERVIWQDIHQHSLAIVDQQQKQFLFSTPVETISYSFTEGSLSRNGQQLLETFYSLNFYFKGHEVKNGRFDAIEIELTPTMDKPSYLFFFLPQSASLYFSS